MMTVHRARFERGSLGVIEQEVDGCTGICFRWQDNRRHLRVSVALCSALMLVLGLCRVAQVQAQNAPLVQAAETPPQKATALVINTQVPPAVPSPTGLCPALVARFRTGQISQGSRQEDLLVRCRELVADANASVNLNDVRSGLQAMAPEEVATQGTNLVETSSTQFTNISARLAALRGGATGISLRGFSLQLEQQLWPGTMVASLLPYGAVASAVPTTTPTLSRRLGLFANGLVSFGDKDATARESGFDFKTFGVTTGIDYRFTNNFILGLAFGYMSTDVDLDFSGGSLDSTGYNVSLYGTYYVSDKFYVDGIASFGWIDYDVKRTIRYAIRERNPDGTLTGSIVNVNQTAQGATDSKWYALGVGAGYDFRAGGFTFGPLGRLNYTWADIDGYREQIGNAGPGAGLALNVNSQDVKSLTTVLGTQLSYAISTGLGVLLPQIRLEWEHEFKDNSRTIRANFVNDPTPDAQTQIQLRTDGPDRNYFNLGAGVSATFRGGVSAFVYYETVLGLENVTKHNVTLGVRLEL